MTDTPTAVTPTTTAVYEDAAERFQRERFELVEQALRDKEAKREEEAGDSNGDSDMDKVAKYARGMHPMLRYCKPYWWPYKTFAKQRWLGRQLLEVICSEFRDRSVDYYRHALECGVTRVNGVQAYPEYIIRNNDRIDNTVHRHEPPVSNDPVLVLHIDEERKFLVVSKPGSLPVHAAGRYYKHTLLEILKEDYGIKAYAVNRLDRLTSGLMILALSGPASHHLALEFRDGKVQKEYIARVRGCFPEEEVVVDQPLLTVDRQMGLVIVAPEGKEAKTIFKRMSYDAERDQSVIHCKPVTGRTHQLRVHLQYLGYPIANDPLYSYKEVWGEDCGKGGVALADQTESHQETTRRIVDAARARAASPPPVPDDSARMAGNEEAPEVGIAAGTNRDYDDINSPVRLTEQARSVITKLRQQRDEAENWIKWKEVLWSAAKAREQLDEDGAFEAAAKPRRNEIPHSRINNRVKREKVKDRKIIEGIESPLTPPAFLPPGFCTQCYVPVPDDPDPETLFIYLHALRYTTERLGTWETPLPRWAGENWDGDWRGWDGQPPVNVATKSEAPSGVATPAAEHEAETAELADEAVEEETEKIQATA